MKLLNFDHPLGPGEGEITFSIMSISGVVKSVCLGWCSLH